MVLSLVRPMAGGIVGADIYFDQLLDDDVSFSAYGSSYIYLIDKKGTSTDKKEIVFAGRK